MVLNYDDERLRNVRLRAARRPGFQPTPDGVGVARVAPDAPPVDTRPSFWGPLGGFADFVGDVANAIPQPVKTVANDLLSGEELLNVPGFQAGSMIRGALEKAPVVGGALGAGFDILAAPATWVPGGLGTRLGARAGLGFLRPIAQSGGLGTRLAAEAAPGLAGAATHRAIQAAEERGVDVPAPLELFAPLLAGGLSVGATGRALRRNAGRELPKSLATGTGAEEINQINDILRVAKRRNIILQPDIQRVRGERFGAFADAYEEQLLEAQVFGGMGGEIGSIKNDEAFFQLEKARGQLAGEYPKAAEFDAEFPETMAHNLMKRIWEWKDWDALPGRGTAKRVTAMTALEKIMVNQAVPTKSEIALLEEVFGSEFAKNMLNLRSMGTKVREGLSEALNLPRALMATWDISAPLRQGVLLTSHKEWWQAWKPMMQAFKDPDVAKQYLREIKYGKYADEFEKYKLDITDLGVAGKREEMFSSNWARHLPLVERSEAAFSVFLNKLRSDLFTNQWERAIRDGVADDKLGRDLARWINIATGRGEIPKWAEGDFMNLTRGVMFAPHLLVARLQAVGEGAGAVVRAGSRAARGKEVDQITKLAARDTLAFVGAGTAALTALGVMGFDVELNPKSSSFGKVKAGGVTYDMWGGFQPLARYTAQLITGERKTSTGEIQDLDRKQTLLRFGESKLSPVPGLLVDFFRGETFLGEGAEFGEGDDLANQAANRLVPLFIQDLAEAAETEGLMGAFRAAPAATGVGAQAFPTLQNTRDRVAQAETGMNWDDLTGAEQQILEQKYPNEFTGFIERSDFATRRTELFTEAHEREQELASAFAQGLPHDQFTRELRNSEQERFFRMQEAARNTGVEFADDPNDPIDQYYKLREAAERLGVTDQGALDSMQEEFLATLSPEDRNKVENVRGFKHDPSVEFYYANKDLLQKKGYFDIQTDTVKRYASRLKSLDPSIDSYLTLNIALNRARAEGKAGRVRQLETMLRVIDSRVSKLRERARFRDAELDRAVMTVYGAEAKNLRNRRFSPLTYVREG